MADDVPAAVEDACRVEEVDGELVRVHGAAPLDGRDREALAEVVRAVREKHLADPPPFPEALPADVVRAVLVNYTPQGVAVWLRSWLRRPGRRELMQRSITTDPNGGCTVG